MAESTNTNTNTDQTPTLSHPSSDPSTNPSEISDSSHDPSIPTTSDSLDSKKNDPDTAPKPKRRKSCPKALDKVQETSSFNFTFDTKFNGCTPQFTPKFGSFNLVVSAKEKVKEGAQEQEQEREEVEEQVEVNEGGGVVSSLIAVDGIKRVE
ncbi:hypothetical protein SO802_031986 [Lithocarpus litseifolius]|uniref:Uncharacterized protein n=1 Tax=Lithocarpus litseifolius TaxID=425828 RepID=A0AAW2BM43_9ROSI